MKGKKISWKFKILIGLSSLVIILFLYFSFSLIFINQSDLALAKLRNSYLLEPVCHEDCRLNRAREIDKLIAALQQKNKKLDQKINKIIFDTEEEIEFKQELIKILKEAYGSNNIPEYLKLYLENPNSETALQTTIITSFTIEESEEMSIKYYFDLIAGEADLDLKLEALRAVSNMENKQKLFSKNQLELIKEKILDLNTNNRLRASLIMLLSDYYPFFPDETNKLLRQIYNNKKIETISRIFAADILNHYLKDNKLTVPEASRAEWADYYDN